MYLYSYAHWILLLLENISGDNHLPMSSIYLHSYNNYKKAEEAATSYSSHNIKCTIINTYYESYMTLHNNYNNIIIIM